MWFTHRSPPPRARRLSCTTVRVREVIEGTPSPLRTLFTTFVKNYCKSGNNDSHEGVESCIEEAIALFLGDPTGDAPDDGYGASGFPLAADPAADGAPFGGARNPARFLKSVSASAKVTILYAHFLVEKYPNLGVSN
mmetsp:Transcript_10024/g.24153  ORF Transcript_10024/g.24153 Transcript_10024/m.24153 type:complete len:137 (+) Transcript_10024:84-494(+)